MIEIPQDPQQPRQPNEPSAPQFPIGEAAAPKPALGGLIDLLAFLVAAVGLYLVTPLVAVILIALNTSQSDPEIEFSKHFAEAAERMGEDAFLLVPLQIVVFVLLIGLVYLLVRVVRGLPFAETLGLGGLTFRHAVLVFFGGMLLLIVVNIASQYSPPPDDLGVDKYLISQTAALWVLGLAMLAAPIAEEIVFRGYIYTLVDKRWNATAAIWTSGLLFGAIHFPQLWPEVPQMLLLCVVGVSFSAVRAWTGSTTATIIMHFSYNATLSLAYFFSEDYADLPAIIF